ncbi:MAG: 4Fe-4S binding protein [Gammaproteobacteria bacterium]
MIEYSSAGRVVIIGEAALANRLAGELPPPLQPVAVIDPAARKTPLAEEPHAGLILAVAVAKIQGHLGAFEILLRDAQGKEHRLNELLSPRGSAIDLVLDLRDPPGIAAEIPPPGYFAPRQEAAAVQSAIGAMQELVGTYEKPRYFRYDPNICVHARRGFEVCNRCIDACPTLAIRSVGEQVEVDPYLCQGGGGCAAVCPSGAMQYVYPPLADVLARIRTLLGSYLAAGGRHPRLLFHEQEAQVELATILEGLEECTLPVAVEELGALGMEVMLPALAYGAVQVLVVHSSRTAPRIRNTLRAQQRLATDLLASLGYPRESVLVAEAGELPAIARPEVPERRPASFASFNEKRTMLRLSLEHLHAEAGRPTLAAVLPAEAPFGFVVVDHEACTLCMACAAACPPRALVTGGDKPQLKFIEDNCVQCGLCERICPEHAITRHTRYLFDREQRTRARTLHDDEPFCCIRCGKPFTTPRIMKQMQAKLAGHWMFQDEAALRRLQMCSECRGLSLHGLTRGEDRH